MIALAVLFAAGLAALAGYFVTRGDGEGRPAPPAKIVVHRAEPVRTLVRPRPLKVPALTAKPAGGPPQVRSASVAPPPPPVTVRPNPSKRQSSGDTYVGPAI